MSNSEGVLHFLQSSRPGASPSDCLVPYLEHSLGGGLLLFKDVVGVFYSPSQLGFARMSAYIYTIGQKYKTTLKNGEKDTVYNY